jgi:hypothetical protein
VIGFYNKNSEVNPTLTRIVLGWVGWEFAMTLSLSLSLSLYENFFCPAKKNIILYLSSLDINYILFAQIFNFFAFLKEQHFVKENQESFKIFRNIFHFILFLTWNLHN